MNQNSEHVSFPRIAMIGVGSMGGAILSGLRALGEPAVGAERPIQVTTNSAASAAAFAEATDVVARSYESAADANRAAVRGAKVVILAVKPWAVHEVLRDIAEDLEHGAVVISVAAGVTAGSMEELVPAGVSIVRAMPNTPALIGRGVTGVAAGASADEDAIALARRVFETVGDVVVVREDQINDVAAVSGSGPAYLFLYVEEMTAAARRLGFDDAQARLLVEGTVSGAAELLAQSGEDPAQLRRNVTSPKGTTERAVEVLQAANLGELFDRALAANIQRSEELARGE